MLALLLPLEVQSGLCTFWQVFGPAARHSSLHRVAASGLSPSFFFPKDASHIVFGPLSFTILSAKTLFPIFCGTRS